MNKLPTRWLTASLLLLAGVLPAQQRVPGTTLDVEYLGDSIEFRVGAAAPEFLGAVILSLSDRQTHYFVGLPPLLTDFVVLGVGQGRDGVYAASAPQRAFPPGLFLYAQGVVADGLVIDASRVVDFVLDASAKK